MTATTETTRDYTDGKGAPAECADCGRPMYYDYADEGYHHATEPERACYLIVSEDRPEDDQHPLVKARNTAARRSAGARKANAKRARK